MFRPIPIACALAIILAASVSGQGQRSPATLNDLLIEIRGLRADLQPAVRADLLVARMQAVQQDIARLTNDLADVRTDLRATQSRRLNLNALNGLEERLRSGKVLPERREALEREVMEMHQRFQAEEQRVNDLRYHEADLMNRVAAERNRMTEFISRLDELERALTR